MIGYTFGRMIPRFFFKQCFRCVNLTSPILSAVLINVLSGTVIDMLEVPVGSFANIP